MTPPGQFTPRSSIRQGALDAATAGGSACGRGGHERRKDAALWKDTPPYYQTRTSKRLLKTRSYPCTLGQAETRAGVAPCVWCGRGILYCRSENAQERHLPGRGRLLHTPRPHAPAAQASGARRFRRHDQSRGLRSSRRARVSSRRNTSSSATSAAVCGWPSIHVGKTRSSGLRLSSS